MYLSLPKLFSHPSLLLTHYSMSIEVGLELGLFPIGLR